MKASVIFTTYNAEDWLAKTMAGFAAQSCDDFELIVADDGSGPATAHCLATCRARYGLPITHVWQPDAGFRKCQILNRAIRAATSDYLIFTDGDCVPDPHFVATHLQLRRPRRFLSGGYVKLTLPVSQALDQTHIAAGRHIQPTELMRLGQPRSLKMLKLASLGHWYAPLLDACTSTRPSWNGHNASTWIEHVLAANGFDHRMQYGGQDREFGERLENAGIRGLQIRHRATCVHLEHGRGYASPDSIARNRSIRQETKRLRRIACDEGIAQLRDEPGCFVA